MNVNEAFPSNYLKASDLQGREATVKISRVTMEEIGQGREQKPVLYFAGKEKGMILNKTNSMNISAAYGPETDGWGGKAVTLFAAWVDFQGRSVEAIRVRPAGNGAVRGAVKPPVAQPKPRQTVGRAPAQAQTSEFGDAPGSTDLDDDIPF